MDATSNFRGSFSRENIAIHGRKHETPSLAATAASINLTGDSFSQERSICDTLGGGRDFLSPQLRSGRYRTSH